MAITTTKAATTTTTIANSLATTTRTMQCCIPPHTPPVWSFPAHPLAVRSSSSSLRLFLCHHRHHPSPQSAKQARTRFPAHTRTTLHTRQAAPNALSPACCPTDVPPQQQRQQPRKQTAGWTTMCKAHLSCIFWQAHQNAGGPWPASVRAVPAKSACTLHCCSTLGAPCHQPPLLHLCSSNQTPLCLTMMWRRSSQLQLQQLLPQPLPPLPLPLPPQPLQLPPPPPPPA